MSIREQAKADIEELRDKLSEIQQKYDSKTVRSNAEAAVESERKRHQSAMLNIKNNADEALAVCNQVQSIVLPEFGEVEEIQQETSEDSEHPV